MTVRRVNFHMKVRTQERLPTYTISEIAEEVVKELCQDSSARVWVEQEKDGLVQVWAEIGSTPPKSSDDDFQWPLL